MSVTTQHTSENDSSDDLNHANTAAHKLEKKWLIGSQIDVKELPTQWHSMLTPLTSHKANLYALILSQQQQLVTGYLSPPDDLVPAHEIPELALPCIASSLRMLFNRVMTGCKNDPQSTLQLLNLLAEHGVCVHPSDWMPTNQTNTIPSLYLPWLYWSTHQLSQWQALNDEQFDKVNFSALSAQQIRAFLTQLRHTNTDLAGQHIHQLAQTAPAEARYKLYQILGINLNLQDKPILEACLKNKSKKVVVLATRFLSRLDVYVKDDKSKQQAQELAQWLVVKTKGIIKTTTLITPKALKSMKQKAMRTEFINTVSLFELAHALDLSLIQLCENWHFKEHREHDNISFISNAIDSLPSGLLETFLHKCCMELCLEDSFSAILHGIKSRFSAQMASEFLLAFLKLERLNVSFTYWSLLCDKPLSGLSWQQLICSPAWRDLIEKITNDINKGHYIEEYSAVSDLLKLGLLLPSSLAKQAYDELIHQGVMPTDLALDALKLNIELKSAGTKV